MREYVLALCPESMRGARQVIRGPLADPSASLRWRWCIWPAEGPHPGGWPTEVRICTKRTLPRWARRVVRGGAR